MSQAFARSLALIGYFGLMMLWIAWATTFAPARHSPTALVLAVTLLPLLPPLRGFLHGHRQAYIVLGLLSLLYFMHGVTSATDTALRTLAFLEISFSVLLFAGAMVYLWPRQDD